MLATMARCLVHSDEQALGRILNNSQGAAANLGFCILASNCGTLGHRPRP